MIELPDGAAVLQHLGDAAAGISPEAADRCVRRATALAWAHTRGRGFSSSGEAVAEDIAAVIVRCAARALTNPAYPVRMEDGTLSGRPGSFGDWSRSEAQLLRQVRG
ncbi:hypothetical protein GCM10027517_21590 [Phycicoccus ginsengisoli]